MKTPSGPEFQPEEVDRLIAHFNHRADPDQRRSLDEMLRGEKEHFKEVERNRESSQLRGNDGERAI